MATIKNSRPHFKISKILLSLISLMRRFLKHNNYEQPLLKISHKNIAIAAGVGYFCSIKFLGLVSLQSNCEKNEFTRIPSQKYSQQIWR